MGKNYAVIATDTGVPIKAWTVGVPFEEGAATQLKVRGDGTEVGLVDGELDALEAGEAEAIELSQHAGEARLGERELRHDPARVEAQAKHRGAPGGLS